MLNGRSGTQVASELGVNVQNLCDWKQKFKALPAGQVANTLDELQAENRRLQKELHLVAQQRDIPGKNPTHVATARSTINGVA